MHSIHDRSPRTITATAVFLLVTVTPCVAIQKLTASDAATGDRFGTAVAISGDTLITGAMQDDHASGSDAGSAYVFERGSGGAGTWSEARKLTASDGMSNDFFGVSVTLAGDTAVVGAWGNNPGISLSDAGAAYVFERDDGGAGNWGEVEKLIASDAAGDDRFGYSVALSGDTIVIGAHWDDHAGGGNAGAAYVFERDQGGAGAWGEVKKLTASNPGPAAEFGNSVAISGDTIVVGALRAHAGFSDAGSAYVFERDHGGAGNWGEVVKLTASDAGEGDAFGVSVAVEADGILVGASLKDHHGASLVVDAGTAYVFGRDQGGTGAWGEVQQLRAGDAASGDRFGFSVALLQNRAVVGAWLDDQREAFFDAGSAYSFERESGAAGVWYEAAKLVASDGEAGDQFGYSVALSADAIVIGADADNHPGAANAGSAYVYPVAAAGEAYCTPGTSASGCQASIAATGTASATAATGFELIASNIEGDKGGLFFYGTNGRQANRWGNGTSLQCVVPPVTRAGLLGGSGTAGLCDGSFSQDLNARWAAKPNQNPGAGATVQAQLWYRDPLNTSNQTTGFSDAIEFVVAP